MSQSQPRNLRVARDVSRPDILFSVARVPDSQKFIVASSQSKIFELDVSQPNVASRELVDHGRYVNAVRLIGRTVVSGGYDGRLIWSDVKTREVIRRVDAHSKWLRQIAVSPDGTKFATVGDDMVCRLWNTATGDRLLELRGHAERTPTHFGSMLYCCTFSNDGRYLATGDRVGHVVIWDAATGREVSSVEAPLLYTWDGVQRIRSIGGVRGLAFSPDGTQLAVGGVGQIGNVDALQGPTRVEVFDWARRQRLFEFTGANGIINKLVWHPYNRWLCALGGGSSGIVLFYDPVGRAMIHQGTAPMHVHDAVFSQDFTSLYAVGHQKMAVLELRA